MAPDTHARYWINQQNDALSAVIGASLFLSWLDIPQPMTLSEITNATREELIAYLESWGFQCYSSEKTSALRRAALENHKTEGR